MPFTGANETMVAEETLGRESKQMAGGGRGYGVQQGVRECGGQSQTMTEIEGLDGRGTRYGVFFCVLHFENRAGPSRPHRFQIA